MFTFKKLHHTPKPLIAVTGDHFSFAGHAWSGAPEQYFLPALDVSNVIPMIVPAFGDKIDFKSLLAQVDGVLVTGARSNVHPTHYGQQEIKENGPFDLKRDATSLELIRASIKHGLPLLAICRGMQELNVALGGTLVHGVQNLLGRVDHRGETDGDRDKKFRLKHDVNLVSGGCLATLLDGDRITVNSVHEEGIDQLADLLQLEALADDGTIEAVSVKNAKTLMLGVQWHPEYWVHSDSISRTIFEAFGEKVHAHLNARLTSPC